MRTEWRLSDSPLQQRSQCNTTGGADNGPAGYLFSPASTYPKPVAYVIDRHAAVLHTWSHDAGQPPPEPDLPNNLKGWNHVEADDRGNLYAIVPLQAVLKLTRTSSLEWSCPIAAHHDLALAPGGSVHALAERPRRVDFGGAARTILDNLIVTIDGRGAAVGEVSLFDVLATDPALAPLLARALALKQSAFAGTDWPVQEPPLRAEVVRQTEHILATGEIVGDLRTSCRRLRALPGSPCDVLHTNTLELLDPNGPWGERCGLVCFRELDLIAIVDLNSRRVVWSWGPNELSGPHQPTVRPDGRILVYDNGVRQKRTRLLLVDPKCGAIVWQWTASPPESFFCPLAGGAEPLGDGRILVTNSTDGGAFELSPDGEKIWEVVLPAAVFGRALGRVSIYRMSAVPDGAIPRSGDGFAPDAAVRRAGEP